MIGIEKRLAVVVTMLAATAAHASSPRVPKPELAGIKKVKVLVVVVAPDAATEGLALSREIHGALVERFARESVAVPPWSPATLADDAHLAVLAEAHLAPGGSQFFVEVQAFYCDVVTLRRAPRLRLRPLPIWTWRHWDYLPTEQVVDGLRDSAIRGASYLADEIAFATASARKE